MERDEFVEEGTMDDMAVPVERIPLLRTLGIRLVEFDQAHAVMELTVSEQHANYMGGAHGGVIATLMDTVSFFARPLLPSGRQLTTTNLNVSYLRPAGIGETLTARSELIHCGRRTASVSIRVTSGDRLIAHGTASLMFIDQP